MLIQIIAVFAVIAGIVQAALIVLAGVYGSPAELGITGIAVLVAQLTLATVALLDEVLEKGHGLGSGGSGDYQVWWWITHDVGVYDLGRDWILLQD